MTIAEVRLLIKIYQKKDKLNKQWEANLCYVNAILAGSTFAQLFGGGKNKIPDIATVFPDLFEKKQNMRDWRVIKEQLINFANNHNREVKK